MTIADENNVSAARDPRLRCFMNILALNGMPQKTRDPLQAIRGAGYDGVQFIQPVERALKDEALRMGLGVCGSGRVNTPAEAEPLAKEARDEGL